MSSTTKLAARMLNVLDVGPRPVTWFRSWAKSDAEFERVIGQLFLRGVVTFEGRRRGRKLVRAHG